MKDRSGSTLDVMSDGFLALFKGSSVKLVVLNACYSTSLASRLTGVVPVVVGMRSSVDDFLASSFSQGFYSSLADGSSVRTAFDHGCAQVALDAAKQRAGTPHHELPTLACQPGFDPDEWRPANPQMPPR